MKNSEFVFDDDDDNKYDEDYLKPQNVDVFEVMRRHVEFGELDLASSILNTEYVKLLATYCDDPIMSGLVHVVANIEVTYEETLTSSIRSRTRTMCVPHRVAHEMHGVQDILFLVLFERCRLVADRTQHVNVHAAKIDLKTDIGMTAYHLAVSTWGSALSRCYCSSILPERLLVNSGRVLDVLFHGFNPEATEKYLREQSFPETSVVYGNLYRMSGQEPFHIELGRLPPTNNAQMMFHEVLYAIYTDLMSNNNHDKQANSEFTESDDNHIVRNSEEVNDDDKPTKGWIQTYAIPDIDIEEKLGRYLNDVINSDVRMRPGTKTCTTGINASKFSSMIENITQSGLVEAFNAECPLIQSSSIPTNSISLHDYSLIAQGFMPTEFEIEVEPVVKKRPKYALLFDISGSMIPWWPFTRSLIRALLPILDRDALFGFSSYMTKLDVNLVSFHTSSYTDVQSALSAIAKTHDHIILISDLEDNDVGRLEFQHLIALATFDDREHETYKRLVRSGSVKKEDSCLCNLDGAVEIHPVFLSDLT